MSPCGPNINHNGKAINITEPLRAEAMTPIPVIIDTDPGVDDVIAILLAITSPELEIVAFNVSYGNTDLEAAYLNIFKVYQTIDRHLAQYPSHKDRFPNFNSEKKPIVSRGSDAPLFGDVRLAQYFHGRDGLGNITDRHPELSVESELLEENPYLEISKKSGVDLALDILRERPARTVTIIALGPLTNLAQMMRKDSQLVANRIGRVICMGGALEVPGNTTAVAEFNFFADPYAVKELLISTPLHKGIPLNRFLLIPLDITTPHELPFPFYKEHVDPAFENTKAPSIPATKSPIVHFTSSFLEKTREVMIAFGKDAMELHDIVAVWCAIANPPLMNEGPVTLASGWRGSRRVFDVERTGELTRGMLVVDRREDESAYPLGANRSEAQRDPNDSRHIEHHIEHKFSAESRGVLVINGTPGPQTLLNILLRRVWGCT